MSSLDRYLEEREEQSAREERELQVEESPELENLLKVYTSYLRNCRHKGGWQQTYDLAIETVSGLEYSPLDVHEFSLRMKQFEGHKEFNATGPFLSALVNSGEDEDYVIKTEHLEKRPDCLGYHNTKNLTIVGDVGTLVGSLMSEGKLTIEGNVTRYVGYKMTGGEILVTGTETVRDVGRNMSGGKIVLSGSTDDWCGEYMSGGTILIKGDAGENLGWGMTGGKISVEGKIESICPLWKGGQIWENGLLKKWRPLGKFFWWLYS